MEEGVYFITTNLNIGGDGDGVDVRKTTTAPEVSTLIHLLVAI